MDATDNVRGVYELRVGTLVLPNEPWPDLAARWRRLEDGGVDSIWSCDHFTNPHRPGQPWFEATTSLMGLAAETDRVRIGLLVGAIVSRSPVLFAMEAQTVDHLSGGRLEIGLGAGGAVSDQPMWGVEEWSPGERVERFAEYVELVDRLAREDDVTYGGAWYQTTGAVTAPGFVQRPRPPLVLAAHGIGTLRVAARFADTWNTYGPTLEAARTTSERLDEACRQIGRDPGEIRRAVLLGLMAGTSWTSASHFEDLVHQWFEAGFTDVVFYDPPYGRSDVPIAPVDTIDELLSVTLARLRRDLS
jgi:alkanesulfonate monooxygenase SsuD/methylene tetrahydromethanopterin reductase-like flavin-dependent oxidoreductase (luciferase family)